MKLTLILPLLGHLMVIMAQITTGIKLTSLEVVAVALAAQQAIARPLPMQETIADLNLDGDPSAIHPTNAHETADSDDTGKPGPEVPWPMIGACITIAIFVSSWVIWWLGPCRDAYYGRREDEGQRSRSLEGEGTHRGDLGPYNDQSRAARLALSQNNGPDDAQVPESIELDEIQLPALAFPATALLPFSPPSMDEGTSEDGATVA